MRAVAAVAAVLLVVVAVLVVVVVARSEPLPGGAVGPAAEGRVDQMLDAVDLAAWERTGAVQWTFFAGRNHHLWDRSRSLHQLTVGDGDLVVQLDLETGAGRLRRDGVWVEGPAAADRVAWAKRMWNNDSFWLNPVVKARDPGTSRELVEREGEQAVLVRYGSGGDTPGDAYLWTLGDDGRPVRWELWVSIIPLKGLGMSWDGWVQLETGAWVSTRHEVGPLTLELKGVAGAATLEELVGEDPFAGWAAAD